ncbi:unnamed protein product [Candidula unifasciata]|uniref:EF-hand domain-containing protein n=1 Tax=Candidula unifasciata TaxID=100452 RepID=A0A8S3YGN0_9EUPU|nr:unnamed protein product [Candidula unifasciata]
MFLTNLLLLLLVRPKCNNIKELLDKVYNSMDVDKDGQLYREQAFDYIKKYDSDADNEVTRSEFKDGIKDLHLQVFEDALFFFFDVDKNGKVTDWDFKILYVLADRDGDGAVSVPEKDRFLNKFC